MTELQQVRFEVEWGPVENTPVQFTNQFTAQVGSAAGPAGVPDGIYLTFGVAAAPVVLGTPEQVAARFADLDGTSIVVQTISRLALSRERVTELQAVLQSVLQQYDAALARDGRAT